jgi:hypothetical protein
METGQTSQGGIVESLLGSKRALVVSFGPLSNRGAYQESEVARMESLARMPLVLVWTTTAVLLSGCGWFSSSDEELVEDVIAEAEPSVTDASGKNSGDGARQPLTLNLKVGDRFPLVKTVVQQLSQPSGGGWVTSQSRLVMKLSLSVEEIRPMQIVQGQQDPRAGQKRLQVRYHRVQFSQQIPGRPPLDYDSEAPRLPLPLELQGYHGLKDNGFQFWLSADNQILDMLGFNEFIERCLTDVAPNRRQHVRSILASTSGADGIANFVDDSIGLLPAHKVQVGESWKKSRQILQPVPMHCTMQYTLRSLTPDFAEVDITGAVAPSATYGPSDQPNREIQLAIRKGDSYGNCTIDRRTGMPTHSNVRQSLEMRVRLPDGTEFDQHKMTETTLEYFPEQGAPHLAGGVPEGAAGGIAADNRPNGAVSVRQ